MYQASRQRVVAVEYLMTNTTQDDRDAYGNTYHSCVPTNPAYDILTTSADECRVSRCCAAVAKALEYDVHLALDKSRISVPESILNARSAARGIPFWLLLCSQLAFSQASLPCHLGELRNTEMLSHG